MDFFVFFFKQQRSHVFLNFFKFTVKLITTSAQRRPVYSLSFSKTPALKKIKSTHCFPCRSKHSRKACSGEPKKSAFRSESALRKGLPLTSGWHVEASNRVSIRKRKGLRVKISCVAGGERPALGVFLASRRARLHPPARVGTPPLDRYAP